MERYVEHLIEDLRAVHKLEGTLLIPEFDENVDYTTTMVQLTGIESVAFPLVEKLTELQLQNLTEELIMLIESYNYIINLPKKLPASIAYQKLTGNWNVEIPIITAGLSALGWMFCDDGPETCGMHKWCDWLSCEVDPATLPVYNGIYDDDGNKVDVLSIPTPDLCLSCAKFLIVDWDENLLCDMTRADQSEGEEFVCFGWRQRVD